jgi:hypothetical protein
MDIQGEEKMDAPAQTEATLLFSASVLYSGSSID